MMRNIESDEKLKKEAIGFNKELSALLKKYDIIDEKKLNFRLNAYKFAFVGSHNSDCPEECKEVIKETINGVTKITVICHC
ncbi:hypothetical protein [Dyadobacter bucti]|uniref:hypothetical protein n=1 Tax=Dyadobacter bucti TaxID=2572203 RepID=UPI003F6FD15C